MLERLSELYGNPRAIFAYPFNLYPGQEVRVMLEEEVAPAIVKRRDKKSRMWVCRVYRGGRKWEIKRRARDILISW